jgi:hypothetical protein
MVDRVGSGGAMASMPDSTLRLLHLRAHGVEVVAGRYNREEKNESATYNTSEDQRRSQRISCVITRVNPRCPVPPQEIGRKRQGQPAEIKEKLYHKYPGPFRGNRRTFWKCLKKIKIKL